MAAGILPLGAKAIGGILQGFLQRGAESPACTVMVWSTSLKLRILLKRLRISSEMPPLMGSTPRVTELPPP